MNAKTGFVWLVDAAYVLKGHRGRIDYVDIAPGVIYAFANLYKKAWMLLSLPTCYA